MMRPLTWLRPCILLVLLGSTLAGPMAAQSHSQPQIASGAQSYPVTYQSWDLVFEKQSSSNTTKMLKSYIGYLLGDGQKLLPGLNYAPLPASLDQKAKAQLSKIGS